MGMQIIESVVEDLTNKRWKKTRTGSGHVYGLAKKLNSVIEMQLEYYGPWKHNTTIPYYSLELVFSYEEMEDLNLGFNGDGEYDEEITTSVTFRDISLLNSKVEEAKLLMIKGLNRIIELVT